MIGVALVSAPLLAAEPRQSVSGPEYPAKDTPEAAIERGGIVFDHYCILCHGAKADGMGRAAKLYTPRPANLITSDKNVQYKELIIKQGGKALGRSEFMPPWGNELTAEQLSDLLAFLESIKSPAGKL
ncbi:MAG: cytochrome c [Herminiimonas sp.]|nr:cytochrome c [Herminiimonas sp.]